MDYLENKLADFEKSLKAFNEALALPESAFNRDASLKRFEFTFELFWKNAKVYLKEIEGIECASPKSCFREIRTPLDLKEADIETCLSMSDDRNLSVHIYSEETAKSIYAKLGAYAEIMRKIISQLKSKI